MSCPEIEVLMSPTPAEAARAHLESCAACAAIASLGELRQERLAADDQGCVQAEVQLALWQSGALDPREERELEAHLERCASCNDVAVRVRAFVRPVAPGPSRSRAPWAGLGVSLAVAAAVGLFFVGRASRPADPVASAEPVARSATPPAPVPEPVAAGAPCVPQPCRAPEPPPAPSPPPSPRATAKGSEVVDPWAPPAATVGYLTVVCTPSCSVHIDGRAVGPAPIVRKSLAPGVHQLRLEHGSAVQHRRIAVTAGRNTALRVQMSTQKAPASRPEDNVLDPW